MTFENEFDAVFSNAALHWMLDPVAVVRAVSKALKPGGRFVAEMGGKGNIQTIVSAIHEVVKKYHPLPPPANTIHQSASTHHPRVSRSRGPQRPTLRPSHPPRRRSRHGKLDQTIQALLLRRPPPHRPPRSRLPPPPQTPQRLRLARRLPPPPLLSNQSFTTIFLVSRPISSAHQSSPKSGGPPGCGELLLRLPPNLRNPSRSSTISLECPSTTVTCPTSITSTNPSF